MQQSLFSEDFTLRNIDKNRLIQSDRYFHDWYRFVLSFPPHLVRQYINEFNLNSKDLILDPFCGTGTTLVESKLHSIQSIGLEANPFAHFASQVKTNWDIDSSELAEFSALIREKALEKLSEDGISDNPIISDQPLRSLRRLDLEKEKLILTNSISPLPLHKVLVLWGVIKEHKHSEYFKYFALALGNVLVYQISNLKFGPEVGVGKIKSDAVVVGNWYKQMMSICKDLKKFELHNNTTSEVFLCDARDFKSLLSKRKVSAVITSPPYPNEKDYTRTTRLESVVLDFINNKEELRNLKKSLLRSNTRGVYKEDSDDEYVKNFESIQALAKEIEDRRIELGKTSGFERLYHKVTKLYFGGMAKHLADMKTVLKPGAHLAYVVGDQASYLKVMIRTGSLLADIARSLGYEVVKIDLFRTRFSTATKSDLNEEVVVLRWRG